LWDTLRKVTDKNGFGSGEAMGNHPSYQVPSNWEDLEARNETNLVVVPMAPAQSRWTLAFATVAMVGRIRRQLEDLQRAEGYKVVLSVDATFKVLKDVSSQALIVIGTHRFAEDKYRRDVHSFVLLLYCLCDTESEANYLYTFKALDFITRRCFGETLCLDVLRADNHSGLLNAVRKHYSNAVIGLCRTHARKRIRDCSRSNE